MKDEEFNKQIDYEYECFSNWIDKKNDICSNSIMDNMSEAYMCGYEKAMKDMNIEITYNNIFKGKCV